MKNRIYLVPVIVMFGLFTIAQAQIAPDIPCLDPENLPDEVMVSVQHAIEDFEPDRLDSYFLAIIGEGTVLDGEYDAYCLDYDRSIRPPGYDVRETPMMAEVYLSYDCGSLPSVTPPLIDDCTAIGKVNWILNNIAVGGSSDCDGSYTFGDIQRAIWELLEDNPGASGLGDWEPCRVAEIIAEADGEFIPGCDEVVGIIILPYVYMLDDAVLIVPGTEDPGNNYPGDPRYVDLPVGAVLVYVQPIIITIPCPCSGCRLTGGGNDENVMDPLDNIEPTASAQDDNNNSVTFGGQAGANTALPPQPKGEWTHSQKSGPSGKFTFHAGTASAPDGTEIIEIRCSDPGTCTPSGDPPSPAKQLDFDGIGTFKNIGKGKWAPVWPEGATVMLDEKGKDMQGFTGTFHYFQVNADDNGEPGNQMKSMANTADCPPNGFGEKGDLPNAECDCPDFYRITIYDGVADPSSPNTTDVIYEFHGYLDGGNLQIHYLTGYDLHNMVSLNELAENWLKGV